MNKNFLIICLIFIIVCLITIADHFVCIPVTQYTYDLSKHAPIGKYCLCPTADPLGADEGSKEIKEDQEPESSFS